MGGQTVRFLHDIPIGASVTRVSRIESTTPRSGSRGRLLVVSVSNELVVAGRPEPAIIERQEYVLLDNHPSSTAAQSRPPTARRTHDVRVTVIPDERLLFRYSAVTFNAHRIHYDRVYATQQEGLPALVVNGGLTQLLLTQLFRGVAAREPETITTRNRIPLFCGSPIHLNARRDGDRWLVWAENADGEVAVEGSIE
jgi:3-methylfumaryl-CoA hydratase